MTFTDIWYPHRMIDKRFVPKVLVEMFLVLREHKGGYNRDLKVQKPLKTTVTPKLL